MRDARAVVVCPRLPWPPVYGGQKRTLRLLEAAERAGAHPHLLTDDAGAKASEMELTERGWTVEVLKSAPPTTLERARQHLARLPSPFLSSVAARLSELRALGPAFVQLEHTQSAYYMERGDCPTLLSLHNLDSRLHAALARRRTPGTPSWLRAWNRAQEMKAVEDRAFAAASRVICVSMQEAATVEHRGGSALVAQNGVDDALLSLDPGPPPEERVLFFGHLGYEPNRLGLERFLDEGWPEVRRRRAGAGLEIAGVGLSEGLRRRLAGQPGVDVLGLVDDLGEALAAARAVVVPIWEGGGTRLKVLESLAAARPVASTPLGVAGLGVDPGEGVVLAESPASLGAKLAGLLAEPDRAARLGAEGRRFAQEFRWMRTLAELEELYRDYVRRWESTRS